MSVKKHLAATSEGLFDEINAILRAKGISTDEYPLTVSKLNLELMKNEGSNVAVAAASDTNNLRCAEYRLELRRMRDPHTGRIIVQMVRVCVRWEN